MLDNVREFLRYFILIEYLLVIILLTICVSDLKDENSKLKEDIRKTNIKCKMYYEDILQLLEK